MDSYFFEHSSGGLNLRSVGSAVDVTDVRGTVGHWQVSQVTARRVGHPDRCSVVTVTRPSGLVVKVQYIGLLNSRGRQVSTFACS